jgi:hypothetical protein
MSPDCGGTVPPRTHHLPFVETDSGDSGQSCPTRIAGRRSRR